MFENGQKLDVFREFMNGSFLGDRLVAVPSELYVNHIGNVAKSDVSKANQESANAMRPPTLVINVSIAQSVKVQDVLGLIWRSLQGKEFVKSGLIKDILF